MLLLQLLGVTFRDPRCPERQGPAPTGCPPARSLGPQREGPRRHVPASAGAPGRSLALAACTPQARHPPHSVVLLTACLWFSFQAERPALNVVIFPLLHEGLTDVIRDVPMVHLDEVTLFKSRVAEEPPNLWW